jgi:hypothetical protein
MGWFLGPNGRGMPAKQALFAFPSDRFLAWPLGHALKELTTGPAGAECGLGLRHARGALEDGAYADALWGTRHGCAGWNGQSGEGAG